ncbi:hypothetical protein JHK85_003303 [Glycine max]|nr:hypothetical protein JHK85_003303 [Glycine max]
MSTKLAPLATLFCYLSVNRRSVSDFLIQMRTRGATQHANGNSTESVDDQDIDSVELLEENFDVVGGINMENFLKNYAHDADETDSSKDYEPNSDVLAHHLDEANSRVSADDTNRSEEDFDHYGYDAEELEDRVTDARFLDYDY